MSKRRAFLFAAVTVLGSFAVMFAIAEIALRFLPVTSGMQTERVAAESPVFRFVPNRNFVYSVGWDFALANTGRINNAGFVNDQPYRRDDGTPLLAVVGDSYIEAWIIPYAETMHGRLASSVDGKLRVYSFGASGAPLSQYLVWARHAVHDYGAGAVVINVVGNDFDESLAEYKTSPGFWQYVVDSNQALRLTLFEYHPSLLRRSVAASALGRYLLFNLPFGRIWVDARTRLADGPGTGQPPFAGNTSTDANVARVSKSLAVIDAFFRDLPNLVGLPPDRVLFTVDGMRYPDAAAAAAGTYFDVMRRAFRSKAEALGYEVIDLDTWFFRRPPNERFEHPRDGHWNSTGHAVVSQAVLASKLLAGLTNQSLPASESKRPEAAAPAVERRN